MSPYLEQRPDDRPEETPITPLAPNTRRIPNLAHALIFVAVAGFLLVLMQLLVLVLAGGAPSSIRAGAGSIQHPRLQLASMGATYITTLVISWLLYPLLWNRNFLEGIRWHWFAARQQAGRLVALGFLLGAMSQALTYFITPPKSLPIDEYFSSPLNAWIITLFGTFLAPFFEEICFRGFLVPAFAIAYDWLSLPRTPEARLYWQTTTTLSPAGLMFSAILTSIFFAMLHFQQVAHLWAALLVLFSVSLVLTTVRVKTQSVAASTLVHASYNGFVFLTVLLATGGYRHLDRLNH